MSDGKKIIKLDSFISLKGQIAIWLRIYSVELASCAIALVLAQSIVYFFEYTSNKNTEITVETLLNKNDISANPYRVAQEIENLETLGVLSCAKLNISGDPSSYLDMTYKENCQSASIFAKRSRVGFDVHSISGQNWHIEADVNLKVETQLLLLLIRILILSLSVVLARLFRWKMAETMRQKDIEISRIEGIAIMAKQVAHDIRSPLSALNMVSSTLTDVAEEKRILIRNAVQRINDIANDLLKKGTQSMSANGTNPGLSLESSEPSSRKEIVLLPALVDSLVSEKRIQFRNQLNVHIESDLTSSFGSFTLADRKELQRLMSNLINNSVEAFLDNTGEVTVAVRGYKKIIQLIIKDNGRGIPTEVLEKLGTVRVTHGKEGTQSGSGLGVYHAKKSIEAIGGRFSITSHVGLGTQIDIQLPRAPTPPWFLDEIKLDTGTEIMCLDDDLTVHQIWMGRLANLQGSEKNIEIRSFSLATEFLSYFRESLTKWRAWQWPGCKGSRY